MKTFLFSCCILLFLVTQCAEAACTNVQKIKAGTPAPCDGWIVSEPQMKDFAKQTDQLEIQKNIHKVNEQLIRLSETEIAYFKRQSQVRAKELEKAPTRQFWSNIGYFTLGVVLTGVAAKAAIESSR